MVFHRVCWGYKYLITRVPGPLLYDGSWPSTKRNSSFGKLPGGGEFFEKKTYEKNDKALIENH